MESGCLRPLETDAVGSEAPELVTRKDGERVTSSRGANAPTPGLVRRVSPGARLR
jgi:hypothetical protein